MGSDTSISQTRWDSAALAFVVEGETEKRFLQMACPHARVMRIGNGARVTVPAIAKQAAAVIRAQARHHRRFALIFDREGRKETPEALCEQLQNELRKHGVSVQVCIGCPDRMIENWILADPMAVAEYLEVMPITYAGDGTNGKETIASIFSQKGRKYRESSDGPELLKKAKPTQMSLHSVSAAQFFDQLGVQCWWTER